MNKPEWIIVHCTATTPAMTDVDARWVDLLHRRKGWLGCGYHEVITRNGERQNKAGGFPTRRLDQAGAHVGDCGAGWNSKTIGISLAGGIDAEGNPENNFTDAQWAALAEAVAVYQRTFNIPADRVIGHRDLIKMTSAPPKACPCFSVQEWMTGTRNGGLYNDRRFNAPADPLKVPTTHTLRKGDTFWSLSRTYGVSIGVLTNLNPDFPEHRLQVGDKLRLRAD